MSRKTIPNNRYCLQETHFQYKDTYRVKVKGWRKTYSANTDQKQTEIPILISDREDVKAQKITRNREGHLGGKEYGECITTTEDFNTLLPKMLEKISKDITGLRSIINQLNITVIYLIRRQNTHYSPVHMKHSARETTFWAIKHSLNLKEQKSYNVCSQVTMELKQEISNRKIAGKSQNTWR